MTAAHTIICIFIISFSPFDFKPNVYKRTFMKMQTSVYIATFCTCKMTPEKVFTTFLQFCATNPCSRGRIVKGVMYMTDQQRNQILTLRSKGLTFAAISESVGIPAGTVKSFCSRNKSIEAPVPKTAEGVCAYCGRPIVLTPGSRAKRFCDRSCYIRWWHAQGTHQATTYHKVCANCGKPFTVAVKKTQKYCSAACYQEARKASGNA